MPGTVFRLNYGVHPRATPGTNWFMDFDTLDGKGGLNWRTKKPLGEFADGLGSEHPGVGGVLLADGSTRFLSTGSRPRYG